MEFIEKISPIKSANKLVAILLQPPPSFTANDFRSIERFLDRLPNTSNNNNNYDYAIEFRYPSWNTEGPWDGNQTLPSLFLQPCIVPIDSLIFCSSLSITPSDSIT